VRPGLRFLSEPEKTEKNKIIVERKLNHNKFRFIVLDLHFDYCIFESKEQFLHNNSQLIIQYSGAELPEIISCV
jgi:hypothetical protein